MNSDTATYRRIFLRIAARIQKWFFSPRLIGDGRVPSSLLPKVVAEKIGTRDRTNKESRIIYLLPSSNAPIGGNKVSYHHLEILNSLGMQAVAFHPERPGVSYGWFAHNVTTLRTWDANPACDFVVVPEIWAALGAAVCIPSALHYAIWVQNGYLAHATAGFSRDTLVDSYRRADLVLTVSADTSKIMSLMYPFIPEANVLRLRAGIPSIFTRSRKEKLITYMPRKLATHADILRRLLRNTLPADWRMHAIENLDEHGVAELLGRSSIFLSFSDLEGYGMPPVEAALCANLVVGYTGQGGNEFFQLPIFRAVANGDFIRFVEQVHRAINDVESGMLEDHAVISQQVELARLHSLNSESAHIKSFLDRVRRIMA